MDVGSLKAVQMEFSASFRATLTMSATDAFQTPSVHSSVTVYTGHVMTYPSKTGSFKHLECFLLQKNIKKNVC